LHYEEAGVGVIVAPGNDPAYPVHHAADIEVWSDVVHWFGERDASRYHGQI